VTEKKMSERGDGKLGYVLLITTRQVIESPRIGDQNASYLFYRGTVNNV
jgi:hypothetical protein